MLIVLYGLICHVASLATNLYAIAFVEDFSVPPTVDRGRAAATGTVVLIDVPLLGLFALKFMEEPDLVRFHGKRYRDYQQRVPMICRWPRPRQGRGGVSHPTP